MHRIRPLMHLLTCHSNCLCMCVPSSPVLLSGRTSAAQATALLEQGTWMRVDRSNAEDLSKQQFGGNWREPPLTWYGLLDESAVVHLRLAGRQVMQQRRVCHVWVLAQTLGNRPRVVVCSSRACPTIVIQSLGDVCQCTLGLLAAPGVGQIDFEVAMSIPKVCQEPPFGVPGVPCVTPRSEAASISILPSPSCICL